MFKSGVTLVAAVHCCLILSTTDAASGPLTFTHQGRLLDASDQPVNGFFDIEYSIYTDSTGGSPIWTENHLNVEFTNGFFDVEVGRINSFFDIFTELSLDGEVWLQIQVEGSPTPINPRVRLAGAPFAMLADGVSSQHTFMSAGQLFTATSGMGVDDSTASLRLRVTPTSQTTGRVEVEAGADGSRVAVGDIDGDGKADIIVSPDTTGILLKAIGESGVHRSGIMMLAANSARLALSGDPDFDLLRLSADSDNARIEMSGQSIGDPDFDVLRITGSPTGADMRLSGDPDFDLLRLSADNDSSKIELTGTHGAPGNDGITLTARKQGTDQQEYKMVSLNSLPPGEPVRGISLVTSPADARVAVGDVNGDGKCDIVASPDTTGVSLKAVGESGVHVTINEMITSDGSGSYTISEEGVQKIVMSTDGSSSSIAVNEDGTHNISLSVDSGGPASIVINTPGVGINTATPTIHTITNAAGTKGLTSKVTNSSGSYAIGDEGAEERAAIRVDSTRASIAVNEEGIQITISADSGGAGSIAILAGVAVPKFLVDSDGDGYVATRFGIGVLEPANPLGLASGAHCTAGGVFTNASDKNLKENFEEVNGERLLEKIESLDISEWNYKNEADDIKHIGPTAQDFYKAFGVGTDDKSISTVDPSGIALAAIKELYKKSKEVDELKKQLEELSKQVEKLAKERK